MEIKRKLEEQRRMQRIWKIYEHPLFIEGLVKNKDAEKERIFCHHDMNHFLDVARLMYIFSMERGYAFGKEEIYATALLHDIGKWQQYKAGVPHEIASAEIAKRILEETGFTKAESDRILFAILSHRGNAEETENAGQDKWQLAEILYDADKISRACYTCPAEKDCNWSGEKKNQKIIW